MLGGGCIVRWRGCITGTAEVALLPCCPAKACRGEPPTFFGAPGAWATITVSTFLFLPFSLLDREHPKHLDVMVFIRGVLWIQVDSEPVLIERCVEIADLFKRVPKSAVRAGA